MALDTQILDALEMHDSFAAIKVTDKRRDLWLKGANAGDRWAVTLVEGGFDQVPTPLVESQSWLKPRRHLPVHLFPSQVPVEQLKACGPRALAMGDLYENRGVLAHRPNQTLLEHLRYSWSPGLPEHRLVGADPREEGMLLQLQS